MEMNVDPHRCGKTGLPLSPRWTTGSDLSTPRPIADEDRMTVNISRVQSYMDAHDLHLRVHSRRTKSPTPAAAQVAARAIGINCQKAFQRISPKASAHFAERKPLGVLVECDTGGGRCAVRWRASSSFNCG
ncbi:hypothetical protein EV130_101811 [Rhizobium azibense]|uniref:Uncharacterized protein n=1 Tax=Rhizobium azibense TaxID=1136135 RepID=A0A4R3RA20_9HYPH|nr:hypothetical protein EV130_101811 [Rhizobium azibense]